MLNNILIKIIKDVSDNYLHIDSGTNKETFSFLLVHLNISKSE